MFFVVAAMDFLPKFASWGGDIVPHNDFIAKFARKNIIRRMAMDFWISPMRSKPKVMRA